MSSSAVASPHTPALDVNNEGSPSNSRSRRTTKTYPTRRFAATGLASPVSTNASSSTSHSTRSRARQSGSPEKKPADVPMRTTRSSRSQRSSDVSHASSNIQAEVQDEEGESEIDMEGDGSASLSHDSVEEEEESGYRSRGSKLDDDEHAPDVADETEQREDGQPETPPKRSMLRLTIGKKRKAEEAPEEPEGNESDLTPEVEERETWLSPPKEEPIAEEEHDTAAAAAQLDDVATSQVEEPQAEPGQEERVEEDEVEKPAPKRAPRKKRKWLKKGEVDPDDPVAVAKQKERHALIDEALKLLDKQIEMIEDDSHPQLKWMLEELEKRYNRKTSHLDARHEAEINELAKIREHEKQQAMFNWDQHREELVHTMTAEINLKLGKLEQERTLLKRMPNSFPSMRDGRGGGGWQLYDAHLLSKHQEKLIKVDNQSDRVRKSVPVEVSGIGSHAARLELAKMQIRPESKASPAPGVSSQSVQTQARRNSRSTHDVSRSKVSKPPATSTKYDPYEKDPPRKSNVDGPYPWNAYASSLNKYSSGDKAPINSTSLGLSRQHQPQHHSSTLSSQPRPHFPSPWGHTFLKPQNGGPSSSSQPHTPSTGSRQTSSNSPAIPQRSAAPPSQSQSQPPSRTAGGGLGWSQDPYRPKSIWDTAGRRDPITGMRISNPLFKEVPYFL